MEIPSLPTDNLYKFMAIAGLTVFGASFVPDFHWQKLEAEMLERVGEGKVLELRVRAIGDDVGVFKEEAEKLKALLEEARRRRDERAFNELRDRFMSLPKEKVDALGEKALGAYEAAIREGVLEEQIKSRVVNIGRWKIWAAWLRWPGLLIATLGFVLWWWRVQRYEDALLKSRAIGEVLAPVGAGKRKSSPPSAAGKA